MPSTVPVHFVEQFTSSVRHLAQRKGSKLESTIITKPLVGNEATFEQLGSIEAQEITTRHADTVIQEREHIRRWVGSRDFSVAELYDWTDEYRQLVSLGSEYVKGQAYAIGRKKDDLIVAAFTADAKSDRTGSTTVSWSPTAYNGGNFGTDQLKIGHDYNELGQLSSTGTGMSLLKLRAARRILEMRDVDRDQPWYIAMTPAQEQDLLADPNLTTIERMNLRAYQAGELPSFYGFNFVKTTALIKTSTMRACWAYTKNSMAMAIGKEMRSEMDRRPDKNHSLQIATYFAGNATRLDETEIVEIECEEAPATS